MYSCVSWTLSAQSLVSRVQDKEIIQELDGSHQYELARVISHNNKNIVFIWRYSLLFWCFIFIKWCKSIQLPSQRWLYRSPQWQGDRGSIKLDYLHWNITSGHAMYSTFSCLSIQNVQLTRKIYADLYGWNKRNGVKEYIFHYSKHSIYFPFADINFLTNRTQWWVGWYHTPPPPPQDLIA